MYKYLILFLLCALPFTLTKAQSGQLKKANKQFELHQYKEAVESYLKVLEKEENNLEAMSALGDCYRLLNQLDEAVIWYQKALRQPGVDPLNVFFLGKCLKGLGRYEEARQYFLNYAEAYPGFGNHYAQSCEVAQALLEAPSEYEVRREYINSTFSDFGPAFHPGEGVVFASARNDIPRTGDRSRVKVIEGVENQLFKAVRADNGFLEKPFFLHPPLRHDKNEGPVAYSADGKWVAFTRNNFKSGIRPLPEAGLQLTIYIAQLDANGNWMQARPFPYNGTGYSTGFPCFGEDGNTLYFASDRPDGYGGFDLFVSQRIGDTWSTPTNLGPTVNTPGHEISPWFDGYSLYFSSNWHYGLGGFDVFRSEYQNGSWSSIFNMGKEVNSSADDFDLIYDPERNIGYFTSNRPSGRGAEDLYHLNSKTDEIEILVVDALSGQPLPEVVLDFSNCGEGQFTTNQNGRYVLRAIIGLQCEVVVEKEGYATERFDLAKGSEQGDRTFEIRLENKSNRYLGRVIDATNNQALEGVFIRLQDARGGVVLETYSNDRGEFTAVMRPESNYTLSFSKPGYIEASKPVNTGRGNDRSLLGITAMRNLNSPGANDTNRRPDNNGELPPVNPPLETGYAVQVAAIFNKEKVNLNNYQALRSVGNVYTRVEGRATKIRVGVYRTQKDAEVAKSDIRRKGFESAFVVSEDMDDQLQQIVLGEESTQFVPPSPGGNTSPPPAPPQKETNNQADSGLMVQLAAYKNPQYFDDSSVKNLGIIEERKRSDLTIMLLSGFATQQEAQDALVQVRRAGFSGAFLVVERNGKLVRVQ